MKEFRIAGAVVCLFFAIGGYFLGMSAAISAAFVAMAIFLGLNSTLPPRGD